MNKELKAKWIKALRSGKYKQTKAMLHSLGGCFCCLGVLCDVVAPENWRRAAGEGDEHFDFSYQGELKSGFLPIQLMADADIPQDAQRMLSSMNDVHSASFPEIASYIEANL